MEKHIAILEGYEAAPFIKRWHYSKKTSKGGHHYFGWIVNKIMYAVADYGTPTNELQADGLASETLLNITSANLVELKRLCRREPKMMGEQLTQFLAGCHRILRRLGVIYVVTFSDPAAGHDGGIYKAANFEYLGKTEPGTFVEDANGVLHHRKYAYRYAKNNNMTVEEAQAELGLTIERGIAKDRWLLCINKKKRRASI